MNTTSTISEALLGGGLNFFLVAALLGLFVAWWLTRQRARPEFSSAQSAWQSRLAEIESLFSEQSSMLFALRVAMHEHDTKVGSFQKMLSDRDATLRQLHVKLNNTKANLSEQRAKVVGLETEQNRFHQELRGKEATLETLNTRVHELEQQLIEQGNTLKDLETKHRSIVADKNGEIENLQSWVTELEPLANLSEQRAKVVGLETEQNRFHQELRGKEATLETLNTRVHELEQQLIEQGNTLKDLETKHRSIVADKNGEIENLQSWVTELEPLAIQMQAQVLQRLQTEYQSAITDKDGEIERLRTRAAELQPLQDQIKQQDVRIRELASSSRSLPGQEFHEPRLRDSPPRDDLTKIDGIDPVLEKTLNRLGYYRFRDIAVWNDTEVEAVARELSWVPDHIRRDKWVAQAQSLHRKKYDETP